MERIVRNGGDEADSRIDFAFRPTIETDFVQAEIELPSGTPVYEGMIVGENSKEGDLSVNVCREKKLTNMRAAGKDDNVILSPIKSLTLEQTISFIREDELVEITPRSVRMRKAVLSAQKRHIMRNAKAKGN